MRLGIGSYAYRWAIGMGTHRPERTMSPADIVRRAVRHGVDLVQIADNLPLHRADTATLADLEQTAAELGVALELGCSGLRVEPITVYLDIAERLGASLVRIAPDETDASRTSDEVVRELDSLLPALERRGITLAMENHFLLPSSKLRGIVERLDSARIGICLDVANSIAVREWPAETIALLAPFAVNLHLKDYRIALDPDGVGLAMVGTPLGTGLTDIDAVVSAVGGSQRDISVILEHWLPWAGSSQASAAAEDEWLTLGIAAARERGL